MNLGQDDAVAVSSDGTVVFVHDDDLWSVPLAGGNARRLTTSRAHVSHPKLSPDGSRIAYVAADEGARDAYLVDARGGSPTRLTWHGDVSAIAGWDGDEVLVATSTGEPSASATESCRPPAWPCSERASA